MFIHIEDKYLLELLQMYGDETDQQRMAIDAMRIGLIALNSIRGQIDKEALRQIWRESIHDMKQLVSEVIVDELDKLQRNMSLEVENSAVSRLSRQLRDGHTELVKEIGSLSTFRTTLKRTTIGGDVFEQQVGHFLHRMTTEANDRLEATGTKPGRINSNRTRDYIITLGDTCHAAGEHIVVEVKRNKSYTVDEALNEIKFARKNRDAHGKHK